MHLANGRWHYIVRSSLIGWAQSQNDALIFIVACGKVLFISDDNFSRSNSAGVIFNTAAHFYPQPIRAIGYCCALHHLSLCLSICPSVLYVRSALINTLQPTIVNGFYSYWVQPMTLVEHESYWFWGFYVHFLGSTLKFCEYTDWLASWTGQPRFPVLWMVFIVTHNFVGLFYFEKMIGVLMLVCII